MNWKNWAPEPIGPDDPMGIEAYSCANNECRSDAEVWVLTVKGFYLPSCEWCGFSVASGEVPMRGLHRQRWANK